MASAAGREGALRVRVTSPQETEELGFVLGQILPPGTFLFLSGELGTGKTLFTRGLSQGLDCDELATSPSFALLHKYEGRLPLYHLDLYRLCRPEETAVLGLEELLEEEAVVAVEWGEVARHLFPADYLEIRFAYGENEDEREMVFFPHGEPYRLLLKELARKCGF
ncbi:MAG TPA: tRNA (adenosine(37)-N6)-threonylcarbamoyltransferase complex ATPase subunit type 1 TsaE [Firmicutes bacterium]|nr:tRNA (adenosine(37)-N6)-threonylcarbamoyltransferase complex ATPase subunit type 1 TsaE [Bacillota bacterium]